MARTLTHAFEGGAWVFLTTEQRLLYARQRLNSGRQFIPRMLPKGNDLVTGWGHFSPAYRLPRRCQSGVADWCDAQCVASGRATVGAFGED
jgi:hypothetical protein